MSNQTKRIHEQLMQRNRDRAQATAQVERPVQIHHGHDEHLCYLRLDPVPPNGYVAFNADQYRALIAKMTEVLASFESQKLRTPGEQYGR